MHGFTAIHTTNPDNIRHVTMTNFDNYTRGSLPGSFVDNTAKYLFGNGIFRVSGDIWSIQRKAANPIFRKENLDKMRLIFQEQAHLSVQHLQQLAKGSSGMNTIDMQSQYFKYTMESFGKIGFGVDQFDPMVPYHFDRSQRLFISLISLPYTRYTKAMNEYNESADYLKNYFSELVRTRKRGQGNKDLMSEFMELKDTDGNFYPELWIRDILLNFLIAGRDTTAILLTWATFAIISNPRVCAKVKAENKAALNDDSEPFQQLDKLPYLKCCLKETLRLYPSVPSTPRRATEDDLLPDGTVVKAGDRVIYHPYQLHRKAKYWESPETFLPERWEKKESIGNALQYVPFHAGPMNCLGQHMAMIEAQIMLATLFQKLDLELCPNQTVKPFYGMVMPAVNGISFVVKNK